MAQLVYLFETHSACRPLAELTPATSKRDGVRFFRGKLRFAALNISTCFVVQEVRREEAGILLVTR